MLKHSVLSVAIAAAFSLPLAASAADTPELAAIRAQIADMKQSYEARLLALEQRLQDAQAAVAQAQNAAASAQQAASAAPAPAAPALAAAPVATAPSARSAQFDNSFNPSISPVLAAP